MLVKIDRNTTILGGLLGGAGTGTGGAGFVYPDSASRPFATVAARNTWAAANLSDLLDGQTVVLVDGSPQVWYLWTGDSQPTSHDATNWIDATPLVEGPAGQDGAMVDLSTVGSYELLAPGAGPDFDPVPIGARRLNNGQGDFEFDASVIVPQESLQIGFSGLLSALGAVPLFRSFVTGRRGTFPFTYYDKTAGTSRTVEIDAEGNDRQDVQADDTGVITSGGVFEVTTTRAEILSAIYVRTPTAQTVGGLRFRMTVQGQSEPFYYWPSRSRAEGAAGQLDGPGQDVTPSGPDNEVAIDLVNAPMFLLGTPNPEDPVTVQIEYEFNSGQLAGDGSDPYAAVDINPVVLRELARASEVVDGVTAEVNGQALTLTLSRGEGVADLMTTVVLPTGGGTTPPPDPGSTAASITRFEIANQPTSVLSGTTLTGDKTFNYNVNHPGDVNGNLELRQGGAVLRSDVDPASNSFTQAVTDVTLSNNQQAVFELRGTTNEGVLLTSFFRVRAHNPPEQLFYGLSGSNNPGTVDTATLNHIEAGVDGSRVSTGTTAAGQYFIILTPSDHDIARAIDALGQEVNSIFTRTVDVRQISGVQYNSYVFGPVNAGASESYTLRF